MVTVARKDAVHLCGLIVSLDNMRSLIQQEQNLRGELEEYRDFALQPGISTRMPAIAH